MLIQGKKKKSKAICKAFMHTQAQVLATSFQKAYRRTKLLTAMEKFPPEEGFKRL